MILNNPDRFVDDEGNVFMSEKSACEALYNGCDIKDLNILFEEDSLFEKTNDFFGLLYDTSTKNSKNMWFYPPKYDEIDLYNYFLNLCTVEVEKHRVTYELDKYTEYNLEKFLRCVIYISDFLKTNDAVWGVGRGSSTASYCLYLIDIHCVNSIEHDLDFSEFLS
jgi:hypothetical protein